MVHLPINHRLRGLYRVLSAIVALYVLVFGITAVVQTNHLAFFEQDNLPWVLGLHANMAFGVLSIVAGVILLVGSIIGRNVDHWINLIASVVFLLAGMVMMGVMQTRLNYLGFSIATCIVSFLIGLVLLTAGLYGRVGTGQDESQEEKFRHGAATDTQHHLFGAENVPRG